MEHGYDIPSEAIWISVYNLSWTLLGNFGWRCPLRSSLRVEEFDKTAEEEHSASRLTWRDFIVLSDQHSFSESTRAVVVFMGLDKPNALLRDIEGFLPAWVLENKTNLTMFHVCRRTATLTNVQKLQDGCFFSGLWLFWINLRHWAKCKLKEEVGPWRMGLSAKAAKAIQ